MRATTNSESPEQLLEAAYKSLEFDQGVLLPASRNPDIEVSEEWVEKGDWQSLASQVGAEKIFFVDRDPVVVFVKQPETTAEVLRKVYERVWCMSRPQLLFFATPGELRVFDLTKAPPRPGEALGDRNRLVQRAASIGEVQSKLAAFHRERLETGAVFGEERFGDSLNRADRALIRDLKTVRRQLADIRVEKGMKAPELRHLHALIGRAIFIRYLEDREILVPDYFAKVASGRRQWMRLLEEAPSAPVVEPRLGALLFLRVLQNKDFTYALFEQLAHDFNGDTFPVETDEQERIQQEHLDRLRGFLIGNTSPQEELFFFAYRFDVIPIELISAIYEEFYYERKGRDGNQGSHYTPPALVEFVLAHTLTPAILSKRPRVLDPACGSGIFLVESFRRMVRHLWSEQRGRRVSRPQLRKLLREQIAGIDINEEAVRVAAFSLYLAFLHYQEPREINEERKLPYLKWVSDEERRERERRNPGAEHFDILLHANSFDPVSGKSPSDVARRFGKDSAAVVVGNPPWGYPKKPDDETKQALSTISKWCDRTKSCPVGDKELSQAFVHLTLELLQSGGKAGLLLSSGVFFKHHKNSREFRQVWLKCARLEHVVNFAHVRQIYFSDSQREAKAISPFVSVVFEKVANDVGSESRFQYWSAKRTASIANTKSVVLNRGDMHWLAQRDCLLNENLWKIYWWGGHRDEGLIRRLEMLPRLGQLPKFIKGTKIVCRQGFTESKKERKDSPEWFLKYKELPASKLTSYGPFDEKLLVPVPKKVKRAGSEKVYKGTRLLIGRGVGRAQITARLVTQPFAFRNSVNAFRLENLEQWQEKALLGIFWSSLTKYYFFETLGSWLWHDEIHRANAIQLPICFPTDKGLRERLVSVVDRLQGLDVEPQEFTLRNADAADPTAEMEQQLDEVIFDIYNLSTADRELIRDMCTVGLDLFYRHQNSDALRRVIPPPVSSGTLSDIAQDDSGLGAYLETFLGIWNRELGPEGELAWRMVSPPSDAPLLAIYFKTHYRKNTLEAPQENETQAWHELLERIQRESKLPSISARIFVDSFFQLVSDQEILFIKRNEKRFWTRTAAREDAESALTHLMKLEHLAVEAQ